MVQKRKDKRAHAETDERVLRSKKAVLAATYQLLSEAGFGGVSVDAVSERSGVAKTTIYRHWASRSALLLDACSSIGSRPTAPDTGNFRGDLEVLVASMAGRLKSERWANVLPSVIDAAERDPELARVHALLHSEMMGALRSVVERAKKKGELPEGQEVADIVAAVAGSCRCCPFGSPSVVGAALAPSVPVDCVRSGVEQLANIASVRLKTTAAMKIMIVRFNPRP